MLTPVGLLPLAMAGVGIRSLVAGAAETLSPANDPDHWDIIEGQGSLMNPAYPGGFEILAASRPDVVVLQHAPARKDYDGFPGYPIQPLPHQIQAVEIISGKPVVAVTVNHENLAQDQIPVICNAIHMITGVPAGTRSNSSITSLLRIFTQP